MRYISNTKIKEIQAVEDKNKRRINEDYKSH